MAKANEVAVAMISLGLTQVAEMVKAAWNIIDNPEKSQTNNNTINNNNNNNHDNNNAQQELVLEANYFVSHYKEKMAATTSPNLVGSKFDEYSKFIESGGIDMTKKVDEIPNGPIISGSMVLGEHLKSLLRPTEPIPEQLLDWLAFTTGSTSRLHLTSLGSYNIDNNGSFSFPVMAASASLSFPFQQNGNILGIYVISPICVNVLEESDEKLENGKKKKKLTTHQMKAICFNEFEDEKLKTLVTYPCFKKAAAKINMVLPGYCKVAGLHSKLAILIHFLGWTAR